MVRWSSLLSVLLCAPWTTAEPVVLIGDGGDLAPALAARGVEVTAAAEATARLRTLAGATAAQVEVARSLAAEGRRAYADADFATAADKLSRAAQEVLAAGLAGLPLVEVAQLHLDVGLSYLAAGSRHQGERELALALRLAPDLEVDRSKHGPPIRRTVERIRTTLARTGATARTIETTPAGALIRIDGVERGRSPVTLSDLAEGSHLVTASLAGHRPAARRIEVGADRGEPLRIALSPANDAQRALEALEARDTAEAARLARQAIGAASVVAVVKSGGTLSASRAAGAEVRTARGTSATDVVAQLYTERAPTGAVAATGQVDLAVRANPAAPPGDAPGRMTEPSREEGGGLPWWAWTGGAVILVAGAVTTIALLASPAEPDERILVPQQ